MRFRPCWYEKFRAKFQSHKQGRAAVFAQGHQFLRERGQCLLEWLEGTEQQLTGGRNSHLAKGSAEVIRLETLISELEKKARQPALELLQDPSDITSRYPRKKFWIEKPISPAIRKQMEEFSDKFLGLEKGLRGFHGKLMRDLEYKTSEYLERIVAEVCKLPFSCEALITYGSARVSPFVLKRKVFM
ncbi:hypothetical protein MG293_018848 [Ovis ammon polii]|uniref:Uncharacterized protein n=1 Tax=Ovis ammon polii TaxID=230172 RepID=A0AAD4TSU3_OVIAM|nr:hypothetical protein MG293_018848 [Ovis ammon polii]